MDLHGQFAKPLTVGTFFLVAALVLPAKGFAQTAPSSSPAATPDNVKILIDLVHQLQSQVQDLRLRVATLEQDKDTELTHSSKQRQQMAVESPASSYPNGNGLNPAGVRRDESEAAASESSASSMPAVAQSAGEQYTQIEEELVVVNARLKEQNQAKVESSSKYRVRLSGLALFNLFANRGSVDNQDVPQIARPDGLFGSAGTFGGSLRQSQIGLEAFGPDVAGARTSAEIRLDFAGGFPQAPNGGLNGLVRLRTGTVRFDWANTSIVAGQDYLFFSPLTPTSYASLAIPALSYSGNLWGWTPQVRVEHRFSVSDKSSLSVQAGILETLSGDIPSLTYERNPTWGEMSGGPGVGARIAWRRSSYGRNLIVGIGGYYGRQNWGFARNVDSWVGTADLTVPLGRFVELTGQFYRGRAIGGLGGAIGQSVLWIGQLTDPATDVYGLDSLGGWMQIKLKPTEKFEVNGAFGDDSPFASTLRRFSANPIYSNSLLSKNLTPLVNFVYRPRSDLVFSLEYKHLKTFTLDSNPNAANNINVVVGYIF